MSIQKQVTPGDTLRLEVEINKIKGPIGKGTAKATVDGEVACSCEISFAIVESINKKKTGSCFLFFRLIYDLILLGTEFREMSVNERPSN